MTKTHSLSKQSITVNDEIVSGFVSWNWEPDTGKVGTVSTSADGQADTYNEMVQRNGTFTLVLKEESDFVDKFSKLLADKASFSCGVLKESGQKIFSCGDGGARIVGQPSRTGEEESPDIEYTISVMGFSDK